MRLTNDVPSPVGDPVKRRYTVAPGSDKGVVCGQPTALTSDNSYFFSGGAGEWLQLRSPPPHAKGGRHIRNNFMTAVAKMCVCEYAVHGGRLEANMFIASRPLQ